MCYALTARLLSQADRERVRRSARTQSFRGQNLRTTSETPWWREQTGREDKERTGVWQWGVVTRARRGGVVTGDGKPRAQPYEGLVEAGLRVETKTVGGVCKRERGDARTGKKTW